MADGFVCPGLDRMVRWIDIENVGLVTGSSVALTFRLNATTKLPLALSQPILAKTAQINAKRRTIVVHGKPRGMKPEALVNLVGRHLSAAHAHAALHGLEEPSDQVCPAVATKGERREPRLTLPLQPVRFR